MGISNVLADALSMSVGEYLSTRSYNKYVEKEMERETWCADARRSSACSHPPPGPTAQPPHEQPHCALAERVAATLLYRGEARSPAARAALTAACSHGAPPARRAVCVALGVQGAR
eukprot:6717555-Prymnesium_polylepis.1